MRSAQVVTFHLIILMIANGADSGILMRAPGANYERENAPFQTVHSRDNDDEQASTDAMTSTQQRVPLNHKEYAEASNNKPSIITLAKSHQGIPPAAPVIDDQLTRDELMNLLTDQETNKLSAATIAKLSSLVLNMSTTDAQLKKEITKQCPSFENVLNGSATLWKNLTEAKDLKDGMDVVINTASTSYLSLSDCFSKLLVDAVSKVNDYLYATNITQPPSTSSWETEDKLIKLLANFTGNIHNPSVHDHNPYYGYDRFDEHSVITRKLDLIHPKIKQKYAYIPKPSTDLKKKAKG